MGFRRSDLQEAFCIPGTHGFRVWGYGTADPLADVLRPGYFAGGLLQPGELIFVSTQPRSGAAGQARGAAGMALVMVRRRGDRGAPMVHLVQDLGGPDDPAPAADAAASPAPDPPPERRRGRPPGSRSKSKA